MTRSRSTALFTALALALAVTLGACTSPAPGSGSTTTSTPPTTQAPAPAWQDEMVVSINAQRAAAGKAPVSRCASLDRAAQAHSADQATHDKMSHTGSDGSNAGQRMVAAGYLNGTAWGENVAFGYRTVDSVMTGWMSSTGHRANILNGSYEHVGVGKVVSATGRPYWTQNFGRGGTC